MPCKLIWSMMVTFDLTRILLQGLQHLQLVWRFGSVYQYIKCKSNIWDDFKIKSYVLLSLSYFLIKGWIRLHCGKTVFIIYNLLCSVYVRDIQWWQIFGKGIMKITSQKKQNTLSIYRKIFLNLHCCICLHEVKFVLHV